MDVRFPVIGTKSAGENALFEGGNVRWNMNRYIGVIRRDSRPIVAT
jgi:hypothetical protein